MKLMLKKLTTVLLTAGLLTNMCFPAAANTTEDLMALGPGALPTAESDEHGTPSEPGPGANILTESYVAETEAAQEAESAASVIQETVPVGGDEAEAEQEEIQYEAGLTPNTMKYGGNVDITPTNEAAIWDAVEIGSQPAEKEGQFTWFSAKLKDGYNGRLSYRPYVNHGGWLKFYVDGEPAGGTEGSTYVEAIQMHLTGEAAELYDLYYAVSTRERGQLGFAKEGQITGAMNVGDSISDLKVVLVPKGSGAPADTSDRFFNEYSGRIGFTETAATCVNEDGSAYTGWLDYDGRRYYFADGYTLSGWHYIDGLKYFFDDNGVLRQDVDTLIGPQSSYHIKVNKTLNCLTVYAKDGDNGYIIPVKAMLTSVGDDTPIGTFSVPEKHRWRLMINDTYTQYATRIKAGAGFLFHSITYEKTDPNTLIAYGYNGLGLVRSAGCIRLTCANAKWIYDNCPIGTQVTIYEDSNVASPFYKPYVVPIPDDQTYDPTDPAMQKS